MAMRTSSRVLVLCAAVAVMIAAFAVPAHAGPEGTLLSRINASRANAGKAPVEAYWDLADDARSHAANMMSAGSIYHNPGLSGVTGVWHALGENVGVGADANSLHDAFMGSSAHRGNILGDYNYVGIGSSTGPDGLLWVVVIFMRADPGLNGPTATTTTQDQAPATTVPAEPVASTTTDVGPQPDPVTDAPLTALAASAPAPDTRVLAATSGPTESTPVERWGRPPGIAAFAI
jgi:hypothetical protein